MSYSPEHPDQSLIELSGFRLDDDASTETDITPETEPKPGWTSNPIIQLAAVGLVVGGISFGLYSLVSGIGPMADSDELPEGRPSFEQAVEPEVSPDGHLKADLAFGEQRDDIAAIENSSDETADSQPNKTATTTALVQSAPRSVVATPARQVSATVAPPAPRPQPQPPSAPIPPVPAPERSPATAVAEPPSPSTDAPEATPELTIADDTISPEPAVMTVISGTTAQAVLEQSAIANADLPLKTRLRLIEPLKTASGETVLPVGTLLIAEVVTQGGQTVWLEVTAAVIEDAEYPLADQAVLAMGLDGPWQRERPRNQAAGIDFGQILVTGAIAGLGLDRDDFLSGVVLDILDQLSEQDIAELRTALEAQGAWVIAAGAELVVHVNEVLELPASAPEIPTLSASSDRAAILANLGPSPATTKTLALTPGHPEILRLGAPNEPIIHAWLSAPEAVSLTFDRPLSSGNARLIRAVMVEGQGSDPITLDVITASPAGKNRWHRIVFEPDTSL